MTLEDEVLDFVAKERGMRREKLSLSDRLLVDLGMDGDDAVEFFEKFEKKFEVDLTYLQEHWSEYFGPEGISGSAPLMFSILAMAPALGVGIVFHLPSWIVIVLGLFTLISAMYILGSINNRREKITPTSRQISIADLIDSIKQKSFIVR